MTWNFKFMNSFIYVLTFYIPMINQENSTNNLICAEMLCCKPLLYSDAYWYLIINIHIWIIILLYERLFLLQMLHIEIWNHLNMWIYYVSRIGCGYTKMPMFDLDPRRCFPKLLSNKLIAARGWDVCHSAKISDILFWNFPRTTTQRPLSSIQWLCWDNVCCSSMWL